MVCVVSWSQTIKAVSFHGPCRVISWSAPFPPPTGGDGGGHQVTKPADACALVSMSRRNKRNKGKDSNHRLFFYDYEFHALGFAACYRRDARIIRIFFLTRIAINYPLIIHIIINSWTINCAVGAKRQ